MSLGLNLQPVNRTQELPRMLPVVSDRSQTCDIQDGRALSGAGGRGLAGVVRHGRALMGQHACASHPPQLGTLPGSCWTETERASCAATGFRELHTGSRNCAKRHFLHHTNANSNFQCGQSLVAPRMKG